MNICKDIQIELEKQQVFLIQKVKYNRQKMDKKEIDNMNICKDKQIELEKQ